MAQTDDITRAESQIAEGLRQSAADLIDRTNTLLRTTGRALDRLAPKIAGLLEATAESPIVSDDAEFVIGVLERVARIAKTNSETVEKIIRIERQVRGDPTDAILVGGLPAPETSEQLARQLQEEAAALARINARKNRDAESSESN